MQVMGKIKNIGMKQSLKALLLRRKHALVFLVLLYAFSATAQKKTSRHAPAPVRKTDTLHIALRMKARNYGDSIVVRWAPGDAVSWLLTGRNGFLLKRKTFRKGQHNVFTLVDSASFTVHPWTLDAWGNYYKSTQDSLSAVAAQVAFPKPGAAGQSGQGSSFNDIAERYNEQQSRLGFALLLADFDRAIAEGLGLRFVDRQVSKDLYYLYTVVPASLKQPITVDTGRALVYGAAPAVREKCKVIDGIAGDRVIKLQWTSNAAENNFSGFIIEKSVDGKTFTRLNRLPFVAFKTGKERNKPVEFSDSVQQDYKNYYYRVTGINAFGDLSDPSPVLVIHAVDLTPPHYPVISSIKDIKGTRSIELQWIKAEKEKDFKGYVVGRSTNLKGPFLPISKDFLPFGTTRFTDEHPAIGVPNYYIVAAVDTAGNAGRSMPAYRNVEDHDPPAQPTGLAGNIDFTGHVQVHWNWGREADLAGYKIFFANAPDHRFTPLTSGLVTDSLFRDSITLKTLTKKIYYKVIAYDRAMNPSPASAVLMLNKPDRVAPLAGMIRSFQVSDTAVTIRWYPGPSEDASTQQLYRKADNAGDWRLLAKLPAKDSVFTDQSVKSNQHYAYAIETVDSSGLHSDKSFPLQVYVYDKGYKNRIEKFELSKVPDKNTIALHWTAQSEVSYYILFRGTDNKGLKMAGNIPGGTAAYEDKIVPGTYQYAIRAVYQNGEESALSDIKTITVL
jgi:fibronectin type 3 domain-containing protein